MSSPYALADADGKSVAPRHDARFAIFQAALDALPGHIAILDASGRIVSVNTRWIEYARQNSLADDSCGIGENYLAACRPAAEHADPDALLVSGALRRLLAGDSENAFRHEYLCPHPGDPSRDRWFLLTLTPFYLQAARHVLVSHEDITERHGLERTRRLLETAIAQSRSGIMITSAAGNIEYVNQGFSEITGYAAAEVLGHNPRLLKSGKISPATYAELWRTITAGATWKGEVCNRRRDGSYYWEEMTISPVKDEAGVITHFVAVKEDITQERAQTLLHESVINALADAFVAIDDALQIVEWSPQAENMLGLRRDEAIGRDFIAALFPAAQAAEARRLFARDAAGQAGGLVGRPQRTEMRRADGSVLPVELWLHEISLHGELRYAGFLRDLSESVRAEHLLLEAQKMEGVGQMAGGLAHDFNNILNIILGSLHLMAPDVSAEGLHHLENARSAVQHGTALTRALSTFARRGEMRIAEIAINDALAALAPLIEQTIGKKIRLSCEPAPQQPRALIDVNAFNNALVNLAINARDAMPKGGRLRLAARICRLPAAGTAGVDLPAGDYVIVAVADNGEGMPAAIAAQAFDPFFTTKPEGKGTGLGLAMVNGFCRHSGGTARILSAPGQGTTIEMILPLAPAALAPAAAR